MLAFLIGSVLSIYASVYVWRRRQRRSVTAFAFLMGFAALWGLFAALEITAVGVESKAFWLKLKYVGIGGLPLAWLVFALAYSGHSSWLSRRNLVLLAAEPVTVLALVLVEHPVMFRIVGLETRGGVAAVDRVLGPVYWFNILYIYVVSVAGVFFLLRFAWRSKDLYRGQALALALGALTPILVDLLVRALAPAWLDRLQPKTFAFVLAGVAFAYAVFRYELLELVPVARDSVIENMRDGFVVLDGGDRVVDMNPAARRLVEDEGVVGRGFDEVLPGCSGILKGASQQEFRVEVDGGERYFEARASPLRDAGFVGRLVTLRDVTERRGVEKRFQALIEHSSDLITVLDMDGRITYQSPSIERVLGYEPGELVGTNAFGLVHPDDLGDIEEEFARGIQEPGYTTRVEFRARHKEGGWRVVETLGRNRLEDPFIEGVVLNSRDVTERRRRERELERQNDRLEEFASIVSHDLRNPLGIAEGYLDIARKEEDPREAYDAMEEAYERMENIIEDVLTLTRQGESVTETVRVELEGVARDAWRTVDTGEAELVVDGSLDFGADRDRLLRLFENLFRNAVEHGGDVVVRIGVTDGGFYVEDDGPGIPPGDREGVFEHGFTTAEDGTGFGLSIARQIVDAHGWNISVGEGSMGGARFVVEGIGRDVEAGSG